MNRLDGKDLTDVCLHESAHAVLAIRAGGFVNHIDIGQGSFHDFDVAGGCSWGSHKILDWKEMLAVFAGGFVSAAVQQNPDPLECEMLSKGDKHDLFDCLVNENNLNPSEEELTRHF